MAFRDRLAARTKDRIYYGWVIVGVVYTANLVAFAINPTFGLFVTPLEQEFGWSRGTLARSITLGTVFGALLSPMLGSLIDRIGLRMLIGWSGIAASFCFIGLAWVREAWQYNLLLGMAFGLMTTGIGQVMGSVAVSRWFVRRRGRAMGIVMMGASTGGLLWVSLVTVLIATVGWRLTFVVQGVITALLIALPVFLLMIDSPESLGVSDQGSSTGRDGPGSAGADEYHWTIRQAARTRAFWMTLAGVMVGSFSVTGYFAHAVPIMESHGISRAVASAAWATFFFTGIAAKFVWGFVIERVSVRYSLMICLLAEAAGIALLLVAQTPAAVFAWAVCNGLGHGPFLQLLAMVWADYFGRRSLGAIFGTVQPFIVVAGSLGPWAAGALFDWQGDYRLFLEIAFALALVSAAVFALDPPPRAGTAAAGQPL
jgi:MFS family permease